MKSSKKVVLGPPTCTDLYPTFRRHIFKSHLLPSMWWVLVKFLSATPRVEGEKTEEEDIRIAAKSKSADCLIIRRKRTKSGFDGSRETVTDRPHGVDHVRERSPIFPAVFRPILLLQWLLEKFSINLINDRTSLLSRHGQTDWQEGQRDV